MKCGSIVITLRVDLSYMKLDRRGPTHWSIEFIPGEVVYTIIISGQGAAAGTY